MIYKDVTTLITEDKKMLKMANKYWRELINGDNAENPYFSQVTAMIMGEGEKTTLESHFKTLVTDTSFDYFNKNYNKYAKERLTELESFVSTNKIDVCSKAFKDDSALKEEFSLLLKALFLRPSEELFVILEKVGLDKIDKEFFNSFVNYNGICNAIIQHAKSFKMDEGSAMFILLNSCVIIKRNLDFHLEELLEGNSQTKHELDKLERRRKYHEKKSKTTKLKTARSNISESEKLLYGPNGGDIIHALKQETYQNNSDGHTMTTYARSIVDIGWKHNPINKEQQLVSLYDLFVLIYPRRDFNLIVDPNEPSIILDDLTKQDKYTVKKFKRDQVRSIAGLTNS